MLKHFKAAAQLLKSHENFDYQIQEGKWNFLLFANKRKQRKWLPGACGFYLNCRKQR